MAYQYENYHKNHTVSAAGLAIGDKQSTRINQQTGKTSVQLGSIGDVITGTVLQTGNNPIVEMNGTPVRVRSDVLDSVSKGDQIYLRITGNSDSEITLKMIPQEELNVTSHNGAIQTQILKNTAKFVENLRQAQTENNPNYQEFSKEATLLSDSITEEEKQRLREMGIEISSANLTVVKSLIGQMRGQEQDLELQKNIESIKKEIQLYNPEREIQDFTQEVNDMLPIEEDETTYLIANQMPLTAENLYKAGHAGKQRPSDKQMSQTALDQLRPQIDRAILTAGQEINEVTTGAAEFLLKKGLPLTTDSLNTYLAIQDINKNGFRQEDLTEPCMDFLAEQTAEAIPAEIKPDNNEAEDNTPKSQDTKDTNRPIAQPETKAQKSLLQTMKLHAMSAHTLADTIQNDLNIITNDSFFAFAKTGMPYTLQNLSAYSAAYLESGNASYSMSYTFSETYEISQIADNTNTLSVITAHRQLEEIRLKMTWEASYSLAKEDINIRAKELTEVVQALKEQEQNYLKQQFLADGLLPTKDQLHTIEDTNSKMKALPGLPASALAATYFSGSFTIQRLYDQGMTDKATWVQESVQASVSITAKISSYETLMTAPRKDMGDSIQKAFRNVDNILEDMNIPATDDNRRAIRILGYNQMEINDKNIAEIKAADQAVQTLMQNLQPSVVLHMVQDGINPLQMPITELNEICRNYIQEQDSADDGKYSEFLQRLDRRGKISENDRKGYIGIYRLLDKIVKSKGKDIGTVVRNGQSLTLGNLLTAHRSNRNTGMELTADIDFGGTELSNDTSISDDILQSTSNNAATVANESSDAANTLLSAQLSYETQITEQLFNRITPEIIDEMTKEAAEGTTLEEFFDDIKNQLADTTDSEIPGSIIPETLNSETITLDDYQFMQNTDIFPSMTNLIMAKEIRQGNPRIYRELAAVSPETAETLENLTEHLTSSTDMENAYAELNDQQENAIMAKEKDGSITALDIQSMKMIRSGLRILEKMSRRNQYEIPFAADGQWNIIHLSVIEGGEQRGHIQADIHTEQYGILRTEMQWNKETGWTGTYQSDSAEGFAFLQEQQEVLERGFDDIANSHAHTDDTEPETAELYDISKQLVVMIKHLIH